MEAEDDATHSKLSTHLAISPTYEVSADCCPSTSHAQPLLLAMFTLPIAHFARDTDLEHTDTGALGLQSQAVSSHVCALK